MTEAITKKRGGTGLEKAVAKLDTAFGALPLEHRRALGLAIYRVFPAFKQYQNDAEHVITPEITDAFWSILMACAPRLFRGRAFVARKLGEAFASHAPNLGHFGQAVAKACTDAPQVLVELHKPNGITDGKADPESLPATPPQLSGRTQAGR